MKQGMKDTEPVRFASPTAQRPPVVAELGPMGPRILRPEPDAEYKRVAGFARSEFNALINAANSARDFEKAKELERLHNKGEKAMQEASLLHPSYWRRLFWNFVCTAYRDSQRIAEVAAQLKASLAPQAVAMGQSCGIIPMTAIAEGEYFSYGLDELARACSGPVALTTEAAPVLIRYLRVALTLEQKSEVMADLRAFAWDAWGDETALDWAQAATIDSFSRLFVEAVTYWHAETEWSVSGLSILDLAEPYLQKSGVGFSLTIIDPTAEPEPAV